MLLLALLVIPLAASLVCLFSRSRRLMSALNLAAFAGTLLLGVRLLYQVLASPNHVVSELSQFFRADALSALMVLLISVVSCGCALYAGRYFRCDLAGGAITEGRVKEFFCLTPLFTAGMILVVLANNLGVMWFALEATALSSVLLVALYNRRTSLEAAWKYVILGSLGLALALLGTVFSYAAAIDKNSAALPSFNWSHLMNIAPHLDHRMIKLAFVLIVVGYGAKTGLAPMHTWLPDAHSEAPSPTSAMLSGVSLKVALYALLRFHILTTACLGSAFSHTMLLVFGLVSMGLAAPFILVQSNLKRLLAYSSLEHVGLICVGIGLNSPLTILGALMHMGYHALIKPVLFFAAGNIHQNCHTLNMRLIGPGLAKVIPYTVVCMALAATAAIGLPPFGLFFSEMAMVYGGFAAGHATISILVLVALLACFCGILYKLTRILLGTPKVAASSVPSQWGGVPAMILMLALLFFLSLWPPPPLRRLVHDAADIIGGTSCF
jgi:hydrogenase-4 component F